MPRGINDIDVMILPIASYRCAGNSDATLSLLLHPVGSCFAFMHLTNLMRQSCPVKDTLRGGRLAGINVCDDADFFQHRVSDIVSEAAAYLEEPLQVAPDEIEILDGYVGRGYALSRKEELDFIRDFARMEGLVLDPVYTGKCMYGFACEVDKGSFQKSGNVLFLHTGGLFGLFPVKEQFEL